jgi:hypothetical protein
MPQGRKYGKGSVEVPYKNPNVRPEYATPPPKKATPAKPSTGATLPAPGGGSVDASRIPKPKLSADDSAFVQRSREYNNKPKGKKK